MNKAELINQVLGRVRGTYDRSLNKADVTAVLEVLGIVAAEELREGGDIPLPGMGRLKAKKVAARQGRNPRTGEVLTIPARRKVVFVAGKDLQAGLQIKE